MKQATMLYKEGNTVKLDCGLFDTIIVDIDEVEAKIKEGWAKHPLECGVDTKSAPTRKEMEAKAKELGISFNHKTTNESLLAKIDEALNVLD